MDSESKTVVTRTHEQLLTKCSTSDKALPTGKRFKSQYTPAHHPVAL
jgi:hypothetical protein